MLMHIHVLTTHVFLFDNGVYITLGLSFYK